MPGRPLTKIFGVVQNASEDFKDTTTLAVENVKSACEMIGDCVRRNGAKVVNNTVAVVDKTVVTTKDSLRQSVKSITDIISKTKCAIPKNADNLLRAALLQQCISPSLGEYANIENSNEGK